MSRLYIVDKKALWLVETESGFPLEKTILALMEQDGWADAPYDENGIMIALPLQTLRIDNTLREKETALLMDLDIAAKTRQCLGMEIADWLDKIVMRPFQPLMLVQEVNGQLVYRRFHCR